MHFLSPFTVDIGTSACKACSAPGLNERLVASALQVQHPQPMGKSKTWRSHLVQGWVDAAEDKERDLASWCKHGTPMGVENDIPPRGIFPPVEPSDAQAELQEMFAQVEPTANYKSYEEARHLVEPELERLRKAGHIEVIGTWADVLAKFWDTAVVSKLAAIVKPRAEGRLGSPTTVV